MKLYKLIDDEIINHFGTRSEAQKHGKESTVPALRGALRLQEIDLKTDKASVVSMLNGSPQAQVLRTWKLTNRGGLEELK